MGNLTHYFWTCEKLTIVLLLLWSIWEELGFIYHSDAFTAIFGVTSYLKPVNKYEWISILFGIS